MRYNEIIESLDDDDLFGNKWTPWAQLGFHEDDEFHMTELGFTWGEDPEQDVNAINRYLSQYSDAFDFRISAITGQESDNSLKVVVRKDLDENDDDEMFGKKATGRYWHNTPDEFTQYWDQLIPSEGSAKTVEGELLRAANKIYYDYYNNGFGNNWSGALKFIQQHLGNIPGMNTVAPFAAGRMPRGDEQEKKIEVALDQIMDQVMATIRSSQGQHRPNSTDMYSLNDKRQWDDEDEDDNEDWDDEEDVYEEFDDAELFGKTTVFKTVQKLLSRGATVEMRHMSGRPMKVTGAQDVDGHPYMFGMSLTNPKSRARLSHPWSDNTELNVGLVEVGPNHYAIVKRNTLMRRGNKYLGQPRLAEEDDDMFGEPARFKLAELSEIYCHRYQDLMYDATDKHYRDEFEEAYEDFDAMIGAFKVSMEAGMAILKQMSNEDAFSEFAEEAEEVLGIDLTEYLGENELAPVDQSDDDLFGNGNRVWEVYLWMNRWDGRYYDYSPYPVNVPGASAGDALIWMKMNQDKVLHWLDNFRIGGTTRKRRLVKAPARNNVFFNNMRVNKELPEGTPLSRPARPDYEI